jgi:hypothetical protein
MLPNTAWPEAVYVHRLKQKQKRTTATQTDRLAITPLLKPLLESFRSEHTAAQNSILDKNLYGFVNYCVDHKKQDKTPHPAGPPRRTQILPEAIDPRVTGMPGRKFNKTQQRNGDATISWLPHINLIDGSASLMP